MFLDQIKVADFHVAAGLLQLCPDLCGLLCKLFAGRASLIPRRLPIDTLDVLAKKCNPWRRGTRFEFVFSEMQKDSEEFRRNLEEFQHNLDEI